MMGTSVWNTRRGIIILASKGFMFQRRKLERGPKLTTAGELTLVVSTGGTRTGSQEEAVQGLKPSEKTDLGLRLPPLKPSQQATVWRVVEGPRTRLGPGAGSGASLPRRPGR